MAFPLIAAGALLAPLVGGAMSLAGGALSLTGGLTHAASTAAGMAFDIGKGVAGAAGGMLGGGKSGNKVEQVADKKGKMHDVTSPTGKAVIAGKKYQEQKARVQAGKDLGVKTFTPPTAGDGEKSESSLLSQILSITTINSGFLANISTGMDSLVAGALSQSATDTRESGLEGAETGGGKGPGAISRGLSKTWGGIKKTLGSVSSGLSMAMKAIGLGAVFFLMKKYRTNIKEWMANIFEMFDGWYHTVKESDNPWETAWEGIKKWGTDIWKRMLAWIDVKARELMVYIDKTVRQFANSVLWGQGEAKVQQAGENIASADTEYDALMAEVGPDMGKHQLQRNFFSGATEVDFLDKFSPNYSDDQKTRIEALARKMYKEMWETSRASDWTVQWENMPYMSAGLPFMESFGLIQNEIENSGLGFIKGVTLDVLRNSRPIVNGNLMSRSAVRKGVYDEQKLGGWTDQHSEADISKIKDINRKMSRIAHQKHGSDAFVLDWDQLRDEFANFDFTSPEDALAKLAQQKTSLFGIEPLSVEQLETLNATEAELLDLAKDGKSLSTHDHHVEELLKPVSKAFAEGKQSPPVVMAPDNRNQSVTKLGDTYSGGLSSRVQDNTAIMLAYTKNLNSTTGQFA